LPFGSSTSGAADDDERANVISQDRGPRLTIVQAGRRTGSDR